MNALEKLQQKYPAPPRTRDRETAWIEHCRRNVAEGLPTPDRDKFNEFWDLLNGTDAALKQLSELMREHWPNFKVVKTRAGEVAITVVEEWKAKNMDIYNEMYGLCFKASPLIKGRYMHKLKQVD